MIGFDNYKFILSLLSIALTCIAFGSYLFSIYSAKTKPHAFTWVIWAITTWIIFFAQDHDGGGMGAWPTAVSAAITTFIAILSWKSIKLNKTPTSDIVFLVISLLSIFIWYLTDSPLFSVIILTAADVFALLPTLKKVYHQPDSEDIGFYFLSFLKFIISIFALEHLSGTTLIFPIVISLSCLSVVMIALWRKSTRI